MPNIVSACHGAPIVLGSRTEYPLGGRTWGVKCIVDVCDECGTEAEPVHSCEGCGAELNGDNPEITGGGGCYICAGEVAAYAESGEDVALQQ